MAIHKHESEPWGSKPWPSSGDALLLQAKIKDTWDTVGSGGKHCLQGPSPPSHSPAMSWGAASPPNQPACEKQPRCLCRQFPPPLLPQCQTFIYITGNWIKTKIWAVLHFVSYSMKRKAPLLTVLFLFKSWGYYQASRFISLSFTISFKYRLQLILTPSWSSRWIFTMATHCFSSISPNEKQRVWNSPSTNWFLSPSRGFTCAFRLVPETARFLVIFRVFQETYCQQISIFSVGKASRRMAPQPSPFFFPHIKTAFRASLLMKNNPQQL